MHTALLVGVFCYHPGNRRTLIVCFAALNAKQNIFLMNAKKMQQSTDLAGISSQDTPLSVEQYASLVAALYRGHFQEKPWEDFLAELRTLCMPCQTVIGLRVPTPGDAGISYVGGADYSPEDMLNFANNYSALAPLVDLPDGETVALDDLITREQLHNTVYYQTFMKPYNQEQGV